MSESRFRTAIAMAIFVAAAAHIASPLWAPAGSATAPHAFAEGGSAAGTIAFSAMAGTQERMYLVDTRSKVILVYSKANGGRSFELVAARRLTPAVKVVGELAERKQDLRYKASGYPE